MSDEKRVYRAVLLFPGNSSEKVWVKAKNRHAAKMFVQREYSKASIKSCLHRTPPDDAEVLEA